jgi:hypothetical protein
VTRWTEEELASLLKRRGVPGAARPLPDISAPPFKLPPNQAGRYALGRLPIGKMNKTETAYAQHLELQKHAGEVLWWRFEGIKLRLADNTFYTSDFAVLPRDGVLELHECKGFWQDDARVKIKVAAALYPFRFIAVKKKGKGWEREDF